MPVGHGRTTSSGGGHVPARAGQIPWNSGAGSLLVGTHCLLKSAPPGSPHPEGPPQMRPLITALASAALASAALVGVAPAANASSSYVVTISSSVESLDLGHSFTLKGTVSPGAKGKSVTIQRK